MRSIAVPVLEDALSRSLLLAASMDARGYGRSATVPASRRRTTSALLTAGLIGLCLGTYGLLDGTAPAWMGPLGLLVGAGLAAAGLQLGGRRVRRTSHRPDPWAGPERVVAATGIACAAAMVIVSRSDPLLLHPSLDPLAWPALPLVPLLVVLLGTLPAFTAPPPDRTPDRTAARAPAALGRSAERVPSRERACA